MRLPKKSILIRLAIYLPLLAFFGWRALAHYQAERQAAQEIEEAHPPGASVPAEDPFKDLPTKTIDVDGRQIEVYEITPAQAEQYFGVPADTGGEEAKGESGDAG